MEGTATMNFLSKKLNLYYSFINIRLFFFIYILVLLARPKKKKRKEKFHPGFSITSDISV